MVAVWIDIFITWIAGTFRNLFSLNIIRFGDTNITYGDIVFYFAIASVVISFIFGVRVSSGFFRPGAKAKVKDAHDRGYQIGRQHGYELAQHGVKPENPYQ